MSDLRQALSALWVIAIHCPRQRILHAELPNHLMNQPVVMIQIVWDDLRACGDLCGVNARTGSFCTRYKTWGT